jgi:aspartate-semialdehyde dehydrogenase
VDNKNITKLRVGVLGGTGIVGQHYIRLLENHPWFNVTYIAASPNSAGKKYVDAVKGRWHMNTSIPKDVAGLLVEDANIVSKAIGKCDFVFSALELDKAATAALEEEYAKNDIPVVSNCSAHRFTADVPMIIPEINHAHLDLINIQKKKRNWKKGFIVVKTNCTTQSYISPIYAIEKAGYKIKKMFLTTMQATSGAGYPGVSSMDMIDNLVPFISGEEEKCQTEPSKIFGKITENKLVLDNSIKISAHCNRVPVIDGHTVCVSIEFEDKSKKPSKEEIIKIWREFSSVPQELKLPQAPIHPIYYADDENRPQPRKDRDKDKSMAITVGRLRDCELFDYKFVSLGHNTVRGAAGGGILNAELLKAKGFL